MEKEFNEQSLYQDTWSNVQRRLHWLSHYRGIQHTLASHTILEQAFSNGQIQSIGPEWTAEQWIFDPKMGTLNQTPVLGALAAYRPVPLQASNRYWDPRTNEQRRREH